MIFPQALKGFYQFCRKTSGDKKHVVHLQTHSVRKAESLFFLQKLL